MKNIPVLYEKQLVLEPSLTDCRLRFFLSFFFFLTQNYLHTVSDFASEPCDFPGHKLVRCPAEHPFSLAFFPVHIVKLIQEFQKQHKISHCPYTCGLKLCGHINSQLCLKVSLIITLKLEAGDINFELGLYWLCEEEFSPVW